MQSVLKSRFANIKIKARYFTVNISSQEVAQELQHIGYIPEVSKFYVECPIAESDSVPNIRGIKPSFMIQDGNGIHQCVPLGNDGWLVLPQQGGRVRIQTKERLS